MSVLTLPLLAGFYGPGAIGSAYLIISVATVLVAIGLLGLDQAVVVHKDEHLAVTTALSAGAGVTLVIVIFCLFGPLMLGTSSINGHLFEISGVAAGVGGLTLLSSLANRYELYGVLAISRVANVVSYAAVAIMMGAVFGYSSDVLIYAFIFAHIIAILLLGVAVFVTESPDAHYFKLRTDLIIGNKQFLLFTYPSGVLSSFVFHLPNVLIAAFFGSEKAGIFVVVFRLIQAPINLAGKALGQILLRSLSIGDRQSGRDKIKAAFEITLRVMVGPLSIVAALVWILSPYLDKTEWLEASWILVCFLPWMLAWFVTRPIAVSLLASGKNSRDLIAQIIIICAQAIGVLIGVFNGTFTSAVLGLSASGFFLTLVCWVLSFFLPALRLMKWVACSSRHGQESLLLY